MTLEKRRALIHTPRMHILDSSIMMAIIIIISLCIISVGRGVALYLYISQRGLTPRLLFLAFVVSTSMWAKN